MDIPFHAGELEIQERTGEQQMAIANGRIIRDSIMSGAIPFLEAQPTVIAGSVDANGDLWTSMLMGEPGFIEVEDPHILWILREGLVESTAGIIFDTLKDGGPLGLLFMDPVKRLRFRINGQATVTDQGIQIQVGEAYGNCPKYIQKRSLEREINASPIAREEGKTLRRELTEWITGADTFFVSSSDGGQRVDASHRGGNPGFVQVLPDGTLKIPDYQGNSMFNTLGNLAQHPKAGLLFVDFQRGATLQLTGTTELEFDHRSPEDMQRTTGTGRYWLFRPTRWIVVRGHHSGKWGVPEYSPYNP